MHSTVRQGRALLAHHKVRPHHILNHTLGGLPYVHYSSCLLVQLDVQGPQSLGSCGFAAAMTL
jgi:hypothetical protein